MLVLALAPPLLAAVITAVAVGFAPALRPLVAAAYLAGALGAVLAARSFGRGDRMRLAWAAIAIANSVGGLGVLFVVPPLHAVSVRGELAPLVAAASVTMDLVMNALAVLGLAIFSRAWHDVGLLPPWYRRTTLITFALGCLVAGPPLAQALEAVVLGPIRPWQGVISPLGDLAAITLMGPLAVSAIAMRGGSLALPYALLTLECVA